MGRFVLAIAAGFGAATVLGLIYWRVLVFLRPLLDHVRVLVQGKPDLSNQSAVEPLMADSMTSFDRREARAKLLFAHGQDNPLGVQSVLNLGMSPIDIVFNGPGLQFADHLLFARHGRRDLEERNLLLTSTDQKMRAAEHFLVDAPVSLRMGAVKHQPARVFGPSFFNLNLQPKSSVLIRDAAEHDLIVTFSKEQIGVCWAEASPKKAWEFAAQRPSVETPFQDRSLKRAMPEYSH